MQPMFFSNQAKNLGEGRDEEYIRLLGQELNSMLYHLSSAQHV